MSLVVEFRLRGDPLEMPAVAAALPEVDLEIERWRKSGTQVIWYLWARGTDLERVAGECRALANVEEVKVIGQGNDERLYRLTMDPAVEAPPDRLLAEGTLTEGSVEPDCLHLTGRISARDALIAVFDYLRSNDISVAVERLARSGDGSTDRRLTDKQLEALVVAHELGYFDEATSVTQADVAAELGVSRSAVSERLRRAQHQLVEQRLGLSDGASGYSPPAGRTSD